MSNRVCKTCKESKPNEEFEKHIRSTYWNNCRTCREYYRERQAYIKKNRPPKVRYIDRVRYIHKCRNCKIEYTSSEKAEMHKLDVMDSIRIREDKKLLKTIENIENFNEVEPRPTLKDIEEAKRRIKKDKQRDSDRRHITGVIKITI